MKYAIAFAVALFLSILSVSAMPYVKVLGVTPDFVLIFAVCWAVIRGQDEALIVVPVAAVSRDLMTSDPLGTSLLAMIPIVIFAAAVRMRALDSAAMLFLASLVLPILAMGISEWAVD